MQQVNLLTEELKPRAEPLMGHHLLIAWGSFAGLLVVLSAWQGVSLLMLEDDLEAVQDQVQTVEAENRRMKEERDDTATALLNDLERLRNEQLERTELVAILGGYRARGGFSGHLKSLARSHVDGVWLSEIRIDQTASLDVPNVFLKGQAVHPQRVPDYIYNIADDQYFAGQRFDQFQLSINQENELVEFELGGPSQEEGPG